MCVAADLNVTLLWPAFYVHLLPPPPPAYHLPKINPGVLINHYSANLGQSMASLLPLAAFHTFIPLLDGCMVTLSHTFKT